MVQEIVRELLSYFSYDVVKEDTSMQYMYFVE
jgi:hypothetical protein